MKIQIFLLPRLVAIIGESVLEYIMKKLEVAAPLTILLSANAIGFGFLTATILYTCKVDSMFTGSMLSAACFLCIYFLAKRHDRDLSGNRDLYNAVVIVAFILSVQGEDFLSLAVIRILEVVVTLFSSILFTIEVRALEGRKSSEFEPKELFWSTLSMNTMALLGIICMTLLVDRWQ